MSDFEGLNFNSLTEWANHIRGILFARSLYSPLGEQYNVGNTRAVSDRQTPLFGKESEGLDGQIGSQGPVPDSYMNIGEMGDVHKRDLSLQSNEYSHGNEYERGNDSIFDQEIGYIDPEILKGNSDYTTTEFRNRQFTENIFNKNKQYGKDTVSAGLSDLFGNAIGSTLPLLSQVGSAINLTDTIFSRLEDTEMMRIGNRMFAQHMLYNTVALSSAQNFPQIDLLGMLKKDGKIFNAPIDYSITQKSKTWIGRFFTDALKGAVGTTPFAGVLGGSPLSDTPTQDELIENTGKKQLDYLFQNISRNIYTQNSETFDKINVDLELNFDRMLTRDKKTVFFSDQTKIANVGAYSITNANNYLNSNYYIPFNGIYSYQNTDVFIYQFGDTISTLKKSEIKNQTQWVDDDFNGNSFDNDVKEILIWGRDTVVNDARNNLNNSRDSISEQKVGSDNKSLKTGFNIKTGLLSYTAELLNASNGNFVDITRQVFKDKINGRQIVGYQGSPLYKKNDSSYSNLDKTQTEGIRQHTVLSPYGTDKSKAIRYLGNEGYGGNVNSVIYKSVLPKIHPTKEDAGDYRKLMFSIENLAYKIEKKDGYGIVDDEWGTPIPLCEIGASSGRLMWFPPYDIKINETVSAKYEPTVMVGRNEPMYNYMNSERSANLSFKLIIDHPEQLKNYIGKNKYKEIAEFFAFGGDSLNKKPIIDKLEEKIKELEDTINGSPPPEENTNPSKMDASPIIAYFPNDMPAKNQIQVFNYMYRNGYEVVDNYLNSKLELEYSGDTIGKTNFGLNKDFYFLSEDIVKDDNDKNYVSISTFNQYGAEATGLTNTFDDSSNKLNNALSKFKDKDIRNTHKIVIDARTSTLGSADYNKKLGDRRVAATKELIDGRLRAMGIDIKSVIFELKTSKGEEGGDSLGADKKNTNLRDVKNDRIATISFVLRNDPIQPEKPQDDEDVLKKKEELERLRTELKLLQDNLGCDFMNERNEPYLDNFKSISENYYYSAFHSQTPEDFHKRLTFLHQCTRQGSAKRKYEYDEGNNLISRNSVFGRQPICVLRIGDFFYTKVIIETLTIDYDDSPWDLNPEGFGLQPMIASVTLQMKVIGGQSLTGPIDALQNAVSYNYYANSTFSKDGRYKLPSTMASLQEGFKTGVETNELSEMIDRNKKYK